MTAGLESISGADGEGDATARLQYLGVADHSKSAHYTGGLSVEQIEEQHREVTGLNKRFGKDFRS